MPEREEPTKTLACYKDLTPEVRRNLYRTGAKVSPLDLCLLLLDKDPEQELSIAPDLKFLFCSVPVFRALFDRVSHAVLSGKLESDWPGPYIDRGTTFSADGLDLETPSALVHAMIEVRTGIIWASMHWPHLSTDWKALIANETETVRADVSGAEKTTKSKGRRLPFEGIPVREVDILVATEGLRMIHGARRRDFTWEKLGLCESTAAKHLLKELAESPSGQVVCGDNDKACTARRVLVHKIKKRVCENTGLQDLLSTKWTIVTISNARTITWGLWEPATKSTPKNWESFNVDRPMKGAIRTTEYESDRVKPKILEQQDRDIDEINTDDC